MKTGQSRPLYKDWLLRRPTLVIYKIQAGKTLTLSSIEANGFLEANRLEMK
jgi:hypothetical protein